MSTPSGISTMAPGPGVGPEATLVMKQLVAFSADGSPGKICAEFRIDTRSMPFLNDHGFQDMIVLPGSFYVEMAICLHREIRKCEPSLIRNISFYNPVILSADPTILKVEINDGDDDRVEYNFYEARVENGNLPHNVRQYAAKLEIDRTPSLIEGVLRTGLAIEDFTAKSNQVIGAERFYKELRANGNQYGTSFQKLLSIWRAGNQTLVTLHRSNDEPAGEFFYLSPTLLDSVTQTLAPFIMDQGKTFILRAIEKIQIFDLSFKNTLWCHATLLPSNNDGLLGDVRLFDESGKTYLKLSGVAFTLLEHLDAPKQKDATSFVIASNFTAEPIEDSLNFWNDHFGVTGRIEFTPYNQIFQQLLDVGSSFRKNTAGVNIILLSLEEWAAGDHRPAAKHDKTWLEQCFGGRARYILPNGQEIVHLNQYETDYLYKEIFQDECYLRHGIRLPDGATIVDIGANIGLFSLFVTSRCANPKIYAFEPAPIVYDLLKANCAAYSSDILALNAGVSDKPKTATFTFYDKSSVFSGFYSDEKEDRAAIQAVVRNMLRRESVPEESLDDYVNDLTADRLQLKTYECRLTTISDIIREHGINKIDLLKIDAEKSELDIINGINDSDWLKIDQLVIEIHDRTEAAVRRIEALLIAKGFHCAIDRETLLDQSGLFNLYATRNHVADEISRSDVEASSSEASRALPIAPTLSRNTQDFCVALRSFMAQTSAPLILSLCPASPAAKADASLAAALEAAEENLLSEVSDIANVYANPSTTILPRYSVDPYYDSHTHHLAHIPYTEKCYVALGTEIIRSIFNAKRAPFKVVVLDCDNTLWKGVCGEDGPLGIEVTEPYRVLQRFMIAQMQAGMLLCLCSKNNEKDALDVFDLCSDMVVKREHLASWRINWNSKSENLKALAKELTLGLDSFIFIDDNPVECAEVKANCPQVLTLQLPQNPASIEPFLNSIWAFDHTESITEEDQNRTKMYQENAQRQRYLDQSLSLKDFIKGLQLSVEITEMTDDQLGRVSQQTFRTNQFNFTTIRRSEAEIKTFLKNDRVHCQVVRVVDRFGDYGLVGVLMYETLNDRLRVDTFLLSCRVLGRGVEHEIVSSLGRIAAKQGKPWVEFNYSPTGKNLPALQFIASIGSQFRNDAGTSWIFPSPYLANVEYSPDHDSAMVEDQIADDTAKVTSDSIIAFGALRSERLQTIGETLYDVDRIDEAIQEYRRTKQPFSTTVDLTPASTIETALSNIWKKVLGRPHIGLKENFFELGGTSLRAVQVIAEIKKELKRTLSIVNLFECPTVSLLAAKLTDHSEESGGTGMTQAAARRGQQRRYSAMRGRAS